MSNKEIMEKYNNGEITMEEANKQLDGVYLSERTPEELAEKKAREDAEGYFNPEDLGLEPAKMPALPRPDLRRRTDKKGEKEVQETKIGNFMVYYNEDGYAVKAERI